MVKIRQQSHGKSKSLQQGRLNGKQGPGLTANHEIQFCRENSKKSRRFVNEKLLLDAILLPKDEEDPKLDHLTAVRIKVESFYVRKLQNERVSQRATN